MVKIGFSSYCHYLAGSKYLLRMLLQLPILAQCSAANPELAEIPALTKWMTDLQWVKQTQEYKDAVRKSKPALSRNHRRLSLQIWEASRELSEAKALSKKKTGGCGTISRRKSKAWWKHMILDASTGECKIL